VRIIKHARHLSESHPGEVLVADTTTPDWEPVMKTAAAIVTHRGGRTCYAAIVARELGIPAVVGTDNGTRALPNGAAVSVSCAEGDIGRVYEDEVPYEVETIDLSQIERPATHIMIKLGSAEFAFQTSFIPNDGVGLARLEFIINEYIKAHPMALLYPDRVEDEGERARILDMIKTYRGGRDFFVQRLSEGVGTIAAAFWPKPVRLQDQRVRSADRRPRVRAARREPDARLSRRLALRTRGLPRRLRAGMRRHAAGARRYRAEEPQDHDPVLSPLG
jgi:pyruvate, water dikinase